VPAVSRGATHALTVSLARRPDVVEFARGLVAGAPAGDRVARVAALFSFVERLVDEPPEPLAALAAQEEWPSVILAALLQATGERAGVEWAPGLSFVGVALEPEDVARLPPHAGLLVRQGRCYLPLRPRPARNPMGFLPRPARLALGVTTSRR
jgi:hypothetical protein